MWYKWFYRVLFFLIINCAFEQEQLLKIINERLEKNALMWPAYSKDGEALNSRKQNFFYIKQHLHLYRIKCVSMEGLPLRSGRAQSCSSMTTPSRTGSMGVMSKRSRIMGCQEKGEVRCRGKKSISWCPCSRLGCVSVMTHPPLLTAAWAKRIKWCLRWTKTLGNKIHFADFKDNHGFSKAKQMIGCNLMDSHRDGTCSDPQWIRLKTRCIHSCWRHILHLPYSWPSPDEGREWTNHFITWSLPKTSPLAMLNRRE